MCVPPTEVGYISATTGRGDHEVHKGHVVALGKNKNKKKKVLSIIRGGDGEGVYG
jgi:hypothetical protein